METTEEISGNFQTGNYQRAAMLPTITAFVIIVLYFIYGIIGGSVFSIGFTMSILLGAWIGINVLEEGGSIQDAILLPVIIGVIISIVDILLIDVLLANVINNSNRTFVSMLGTLFGFVINFGFGGLAVGRIYQVLFMEPEAAPAE